MLRLPAVTSLAVLALAAVPFDASSAAAYEETVVGTGEASMSMNADGKYVIVVNDPDSPTGASFYYGNASGPVPPAANLFGIRPDTETLNTAVLRNGTRIIAWDEEVAPLRMKGYSLVFGDSHGNGGRTSSVQALPKFRFMQFPLLTAGPNGAAVRYWAWSGGRDSRLYASFLKSSGEFGDPIVVHTEREREAITGVEAGFDGRGNVTFTWWRNPRTLMTATGNRRHRFGRAQKIDGFDGCAIGKLAVTEKSGAVYVSACGGAVKYASRRPGGRFDRIRSLTSKTSRGHIDADALALSDGRVLMAWNQVRGDAMRTFASIGTPGSGFSAPRAITPFFSTSNPGAAAPTPGGDSPELRWIPMLLPGTGGKPYIVGRLETDAVARAAPVDVNLSLGPSTVVYPNLDYRDVAISEAGHTLAFGVEMSDTATTQTVKLVRSSTPSP